MINETQKTLDYYMSLPYRLELIPDLDEGEFVASYPDLPGCLTIGETPEEAIKNAAEAKLLWLKAAMQDNIKINEPVLAVI